MKALSKYIGIPYEPHGRTEAGCDCWGLAIKIAKEIFNLDIPAYDEYSDQENWHEMTALIKKNITHWIRIPKGLEKPGDFVLMRLYGMPLHVGVVIGGDRMIHIMKGINSVIESYTGKMWTNRVLGIYRYSNA